MIETPYQTSTSAQAIAKIPLRIPREEIQQAMGPGIQELFAILKAQEIAPVGPWLTHHLTMSPEIFDFEICVPVAVSVVETGRVKPGVLPAAIVLRTVYQGPYEGLGAAWGEFQAWIAAQGHETADELWECYLVGPESSPDPANWRTELTKPLLPKEG